jgi:hypothetical protein
MASALAIRAQAADSLQGEWESADGSFKLEFQGQGKCYISGGPMTSECTYTQNGKQTIVKIPDDDEPLVLTANADGSLSNPKDAFIPMRFKKKKQ